MEISFHHSYLPEIKYAYSVHRLWLCGPSGFKFKRCCLSDDWHWRVKGVFITAEKTDQNFLTGVCPRKCNGQKPTQNKNIRNRWDSFGCRKSRLQNAFLISIFAAEWVITRVTFTIKYWDIPLKVFHLQLIIASNSVLLKVWSINKKSRLCNFVRKLNFIKRLGNLFWFLSFYIRKLTSSQLFHYWSRVLEPGHCVGQDPGIRGSLRSSTEPGTGCLTNLGGMV